MHVEILLDQPLSWRQVAAVAEGAALRLSVTVLERVRAARDLVDAIVARGVRAYGVNAV
jgi:histidine ammonia-lyase